MLIPGPKIDARGTICPLPRTALTIGGMSVDAIITLIILVATLLLMGSQRLRADLTALLVMLSLILTGVLEPQEAFDAFGQPVIIIIPAIFIIGAALYETGVAAIIASQLQRFGRRGDTVLLLAVMLTAGLLSAVLSDLLVVAILLPAVLRLARRVDQAPGQFLIPMTAAAVIGNLLTLIGAISNLVINDILVGNGFDSLGLFTLTPYGLASLAIAVLWFLLVGRRLLPEDRPEVTERPSLEEVAEIYDLREHLYQLRVRAGSDLIGTRLDQSGLAPEYRLNVVAIQPAQDDLRPARPDWILERDDLLVVEGERGDVHQAATLHALQPKGSIPLERFETLKGEALRLAEVIVPIRSDLAGKTVLESRIRERMGLNVLAVHRHGQPLHGELKEHPLLPGDTLLVQGPLARLRQLGNRKSLVLVTHLGPGPGDLITAKAGLTLVVLLVMLVTVVTGFLSLAVASLAAALALILGGAITPGRAYESVDGSLLVLIGGMLPLATALDQSGLAAILADVLASLSQGMPPILTIFLFYLLAALLTQVISNTVTGVLLLPIAVNLAVAQSLSPYPFAIAVIIAVTTAYVTPLTLASNLMIRDPGHYAMRHFLLNNGAIFLIQSVTVMVLLSLFYF